jgi:hypothetical protein
MLRTVHKIADTLPCVHENVGIMVKLVPTPRHILQQYSTNSGAQRKSFLEIHLILKNFLTMLGIVHKHADTLLCSGGRVGIVVKPVPMPSNPTAESYVE